MFEIPFNKPHLTGKEVHYIYEAVNSGKISGDGMFTKKCHRFFEEKFGFKKCLLTTSCTDALEMAALLIDVQPGDEVIVPSYTFVSTANAFLLRGARIVFADSREDHPNIDETALESLVTPKTKAIVPVHYSGIACDMDTIMSVAARHGLFVVEDAAQAIQSHYKGRPLGGIGHLAAFSFHESKNIISGEGGMLVVNEDRFLDRAEIIWEKGTNRAAFFRGEVNKYEWVDLGSSFLPSDVTGAFLYAQLENLDDIQARRCRIWETYHDELRPLEIEGKVRLRSCPDYATNNGHIFYLLCSSADERNGLARHLKERGILAVFHYLALHRSPFFSSKHDGRDLPMADRYTDCLLRLPLYYGLSENEQAKVVAAVKAFYS